MSEASPPGASPEAPRQLDARRKAWVRDATPRMIRLARKMSGLLPRVNADDLQSIGSEALVKAALRYDPSTQIPFESFAFYRVRGAMIDGARAEDRAGRQAKRAQIALRRSQELLESTAKDASKKSDDRRSLAERVEAAKRLVEKTAAIAMMTRARVTEIDNVGDPQGSDSSGAESVLLHREQLEQLRGLVAELPEQEQALVQAVYMEGKSLTEFAKTTDKSLATISRRHSKLLGKLADRMRARGSR